MRSVFLSDIHYPYHSEQAWGMALDLVGQMAPDLVILGGDIFDFYQVSHFMKDPMRRFELQADIDVGVKELRKLRRALPKAEFYFIEGNHELRLQSYLFSVASEVAGLRGLQLPELLRFGDLDIKKFFKTGQPHLRIGHLSYVHGHETKTSGVHPARHLWLKTGVNIVCGHVHRMDRHGDRSLTGVTHEAHTNGCLCVLTPDYMVNPQWDNGFIMVDHFEGGLFGVQQIKFFEYKGSMHTIFNGQMHRATKGGKVKPLPRAVTLT